MSFLVVDIRFPAFPGWTGFRRECFRTVGVEWVLLPRGVCTLYADQDRCPPVCGVDVELFICLQRSEITHSYICLSTGKLRDSCSSCSSFLTCLVIGTLQKLYRGEERRINPTYLVLQLDLAASGMLEVVSRLF